MVTVTTTDDREQEFPKADYADSSGEFLYVYGVREGRRIDHALFNCTYVKNVVLTDTLTSLAK